MFIVYHSNHLEVHKDILLDRINREPLSNPLQQEVILVQSPGMAQWLQLQIAQKQGVAANLAFPMPASFIWQQYADNLPNVAQHGHFNKQEMTWRLLELLKRQDFRPHFDGCEAIEQPSQHKDYQLARKIADLFDQYLVYRPDWIMAWERNDDDYIERKIQSQYKSGQAGLHTRIRRDIAWQGALWRALTAQAGTSGNAAGHRAYLHQQYLQKLQREKPKNLPSRLFIFGIPALPQVYLETFKAISAYCDVHLFFNNPSRYYWGDLVDPAYLQKLKITHRTLYGQTRRVPLFSERQLQNLEQERFELTQDEEKLQIGHPLLAAWGKLGRDFCYLLTQAETQEIEAYVESAESSLLSQVQNRILNLTPSGARALHRAENDQSLSIHSCHSAMREVEVLHDYLLQRFQQDATLTPKDIVVMVADIDQYAPYIRAVFRRYEDRRYIPFSISDGKLSESDVLLAAFLSLLKLKDSQFAAEDVLALLDIPAIRTRFAIEAAELEQLRHWVAASGIRFGLHKYSSDNPNYNAWQAGLERLLLGYALREENGIWQDSLGFDGSYGLKGQQVGALAEFIRCLSGWREVLQQAHSMEQWQHHLTALADDFFCTDEQTADTLFYIKNSIQELAGQLHEIPFEQPIESEVMLEVMAEKLNDGDHGMKFLVGKVSFCTLMPMRSIPFRTVCLLGMNDGDYPRRQTRNSFDLMQYHRQKGDRSRRDDDRYLFLEALLAAQDNLYISYVGRSIIDNQAKEPSVLVSQLLDYLYDNLPVAEREKSLVRQHSMSVFSPQNFSETHRTFAKEWLPPAGNRSAVPADFVQPAIQTEREESVEFSRLISFVQNPVRFFFEQRLGVYFRNEDELIGDTENFTLDGLQLYEVNRQLLDCSVEQTEDFFANLNVKGILPRAEFGRIYQYKVRSEMAAFSDIIEHYREQQPGSEFIELRLAPEQGEILLYGNIDHLFGAQKQRVVWRAGRNTERYLIENWLYYLLQAATCENAVPPLFYAKGDKGVETCSFKTVEKTTALEMLECYTEGYLQNARRLLPVPTVKIDAYLKLLKRQPIDPEQCLAHINKLAYGDDYNRGDIYWQRVLTQTTTLDLEPINQTVEQWFGAMLENLVRVKN